MRAEASTNSSESATARASLPHRLAKASECLRRDVDAIRKQAPEDRAVVARLGGTATGAWARLRLVVGAASRKGRVRAWAVAPEEEAAVVSRRQEGASGAGPVHRGSVRLTDAAPVRSRFRAR